MNGWAYVLNGGAIAALITISGLLVRHLISRDKVKDEKIYSLAANHINTNTQVTEKLIATIERSIEVTKELREEIRRNGRH